MTAMLTSMGCFSSSGDNTLSMELDACQQTHVKPRSRNSPDRSHANLAARADSAQEDTISNHREGNSARNTGSVAPASNHAAKRIKRSGELADILVSR